MNPADINIYIEMAKKRKWYIIIPFLLTILAGMAYLLSSPKIYEAQTLILVQSQSVPQDFVRNIVSTTIEDRLRSITQEVTSRTNLEKMISTYQLFPDQPSTMTIDDKVLALRKAITIDINTAGRRRATNAFTISIRGKDPKTLMMVANGLASNFISENLKIRETQALGTTKFLSNELDSAEKRLKEKEEALKKYHEKYMGGLPEQLNSNLSILGRLQDHLDQLNDNLRDAENRKILIQREFAEQESSAVYYSSGSGTDGQGVRDLESLKNELATLESKYTQNHPDIIRLKNMIAKMESRIPANDNSSESSNVILTQAGRAIQRQLQNLSFEMDNIKSEISETKSQIKRYQLKVEDTPKREQELLSLRRDYGNLQELYNSLLNRQLEAEIAVSMEKNQKGEQFRIVDPAKIPSRPVEPDVKKIILMTFAIGLALGGGLAFLKEILDTSYKSPEEISAEIQLPFLVSLPYTYTEKEKQTFKRNNLLAYTITSLLFIMSAFGIVIATKGMEKVIEFAGKLF